MFKASNVADSLWQMNLFMALQVCRNLSNLSYMAVSHSPESESDDRAEEADEPRPAILDRRPAA
jgi:hypothetical protein